MAGGPEGAKKFATETINKVKKSNQEVKNSVKDYPDQEKNKLQALAGSVQKGIEGDGKANSSQRAERGNLKITGERGVYKLGSYGKTTSIQKVGSDYKVLGQLFDKPEEAIKYANIFNFMKNDVIKHGGIKTPKKGNIFLDLTVPKEPVYVIEYADGKGSPLVRDQADSKGDSMFTLTDERKLTRNLNNYLIKFAQNNNLIKS